jgi:beta-glucosidase
VTENGTSILGENDLPREQILKDDFRVAYYAEYVENMARAFKEDGVNVRSYSAWSLMVCFLCYVVFIFQA